jgi:chromosome segregation ATPase
LQSEIGTHRNQIEFNRQRTEEITELISRAKAEIVAAEAKRARQELELRELNALVEKTGNALKAKQAELNQLSERSAELRADRTAQEEQLQTLQLASAKNISHIAALEDDLSSLNVRRDATLDHLRSLESAQATALETQQKAETALAAVRRATEGERKNVGLLLAEAQAAETTLQQHRVLLAEAEKQQEKGFLPESAVTQLRAGMTQLQSRVEILSERESQLTVELRKERARLSDLNERLDALEREMLISGQAADIKTDIGIGILQARERQPLGAPPLGRRCRLARRDPRAVDRMLAENRRRAIHDLAQSFSALALRQMRYRGLARDVVRGRQTRRGGSAVPDHQMAVADAVMEFDPVI